MPSRRTRLLIALLTAAAWGGYVWLAAMRQPDFVSDFDQVWAAARMIRSGVDPYAAIGPGRAFDFSFPFYYPLTAAVVVVPFSFFDVVWARVLWVALPTFALCYLVTRDNYQRLPLFLSGSLFGCALNVQWAPWVMCGMLVPWMGGVVSGKPNIGIAAVAGMGRWRQVMLAAAGSLVLLLISLAIDPHWPLEWLYTVRTADHFIPYIARPGGVLLLLAALRFRDPAARILLALALVPSTAATYDTLLLFACVTTFRQTLVLSILTHLAYIVAVLTGDPAASFATYTTASARAVLWLVYVPVLWWVMNAEVYMKQLPTILRRAWWWVVAAGCAVLSAVIVHSILQHPRVLTSQEWASVGALLFFAMVAAVGAAWRALCHPMIPGTNERDVPPPGPPPPPPGNGT